MAEPAPATTRADPTASQNMNNPLLHRALTLVHAFNTMDLASILAHRAPHCTRTIHPRNLNLPVQDNATYMASLRSLTTVFHNFELEVRESVVDVGARKVVLFLCARADTVVGEYRNEYVWVLEFEWEGTREEGDGLPRIVRQVEFVDSVMARDFFLKLKEAMGRAGRGGEGGKEGDKAVGVEGK